MKMRLTGFQQLWHACMHYWVGCLCSFKFLHPPQNPFLWVHSMGLINEYFSKGFGCCLFLFYTLPQEQRWEWCQGLSFPLCHFITVQPPLLTLLWLTGNKLVMPFGWQAGIQLFLQKLMCPVDFASRIGIPEHNPNDHSANFENIRASSQLLRSKSIVSAEFSRVGIYIPKMPSRNGRLLRLRMKGLGLSSPPGRKDIVVLLFASAAHLTNYSYAEGWEMGSAMGASAPQCVRNSHSDVAFMNWLLLAVSSKNVHFHLILPTWKKLQKT